MNNSVKMLSPFVLYCQKVIPLAFDESMSYYECLCALYSYLKDTVVPAVNNNADALKEVQEKMVELKEYVDTYFDNLDIQTEIDNKLDEMAESGQLADIIAQYLEIASVLGFDTVSDMAQSDNLSEGSIARTLGHDTYNDRKGGFFKVRTIKNTDVVDGINIVALDVSDTLIAELIGESLIKVYDTIDDLISADNLMIGDKVEVVGEKEVNDGRGSLFSIRAKDISDTESYDLIFLQGNMVATRINLYAGKTTGKMYGICDTAVISNINNTGIRAQVMGFHNDNELATYGNRDHVIQYKEFRSQTPNSYTISSVDETSVTLTNNPQNVYIGSIIDLYPDNTYNKTAKYSGFVTDINENVISVEHWYLYNDTSTGQIPTSVTLACIDMPTKVWVNNDNLILTSAGNVQEGVIAEYGLFNEKYNADTNPNARANGIDIVGMSGLSDYGIQIRESGGNISCGLLASDCQQALLSRDCDYIVRGEKSGNEVMQINQYGGIEINTSSGTSNYMLRHNNRNLVVNGDGYIQTQSLKIVEKSGNITLDTSEGSFFLLTGSNVVTVDSGAEGRMIYIKSRSALNNVVINGNTYGLQQHDCVCLLRHGTVWIDVFHKFF